MPELSETLQLVADPPATGLAADPVPVQRRGLPRTVIAFGIPAVVGIVVVVGAILTSGVRLLVVETPSMGTAAPVGTLVVDVPARISALAVGDVISYHPPDIAGTTYTHRIVRIADDHVVTRGDINGAADSWRIHQSEIVGRALLLLPGVGWLVKALPLLLIGSAVIWIGTTAARSRSLRSGLRVLGATVLGAAAIVVLKPLTAVVVLTTASAHGGTLVTFVSTGVLPVAVRSEAGGPAVRLLTGEVGRLLLRQGAGQRSGFVATLSPDPLQWGLIALVCALPLLWVLVFGLAADDPTPVAP